MREPPEVDGYLALAHGITPACAGTTGKRRSCPLPPEDHPRVCGNHLPCSVAACPMIGSPPRVREPLSEGFACHMYGRITPACAGTTKSRNANVRHSKDHPRVCGNHSNTMSYSLCFSGSPPRVREPPDTDPKLGYTVRITPACAGTTDHPSGEVRTPQDHPRVCGNHKKERDLSGMEPGSPPRVREPQIKDPIKSAFLSRRLSKNIHFLRELKNQLRILQSSMRYFIRNTI